MSVANPTFGDGLGQLIGSEIGAHDLSAGLDNVNSTSGDFKNATAPYNTFGQSFLAPAAGAIGKVASTAGTAKSYDQFMTDYKNSPGVAYQVDQADKAQEESAASRGGLLSGTNMRALGTINNGIVSTGANTAYNEYLQGNSQQFGQLESSLGNMFNAIGVGTTATGQQAGVATGQMNAQANIAAAQAKNDQGKGSGLGSMFSGVAGMAAMF